MTELVTGILLAVVIYIVYRLGRRRHNHKNLPALSDVEVPAVSEDINLPIKQETRG